MLIQYAYIKPRSQFGKQCFLGETDSVVQENILPDPKLMGNYIRMSHCHRGVQKSKQFALHEIQTARKITKESGILHSEGGWPKEINVKDDDAVLRFRRRVMKDDCWAPKMRNLIDPMECCILQNNALNIYEHFFDDMEPTTLVLPRSIRTSNLYADPQSIVRPINHLSWSPSAQNRLAAAYTFMEFEIKPTNVNPSSYIWDIENPNTPVVCLRSSSPLIIVEFNPRDPSMLISGLMSGQVCNWDIRIGDGPVQMSHRRFSHRNPANQTLWIQSKTNTEFFSASTDGMIKWWDIRNMRQPTDELVMDLDEPLRQDIIRAIGITKLQYEPTIGQRFLVGTTNGTMVNVRRKVASPINKLALRFKCHVGPVITIDRNPFVMKYFLTVGDWTVKIWTEDIKESSLISLRERSADLRGACWSRSRYSVFFTIDSTGLLEIYDILNGVNSPMISYRVCNDSLTVIAPHENGQLLAVGGRDGNIYLVECSEGFTINTRTDKGNFVDYLERCSRFEKTADIRLREMRLMQTSVREDSIADHPAIVSKTRRKSERDKYKAHVKEKGDPRRKSRPRKSEKEIFFEELTELDEAFFEKVKKELASYSKLDPETEQMIRQEMQHKKRMSLREPEDDKFARKKNNKYNHKNAKHEKMIEIRDEVLTIEEIETDEEEKEYGERVVSILEEPFVEPRRAVKKRREKQILSRVCVEVCKPEICCADLEEKRKAELRTQLSSEEKKSSWVIAQRQRKLFDLEQKLPEHSSVGKRRVLLGEDESLADVLADKVEEARREMRAWQEKIALDKRDFWRLQTIVHQKPEGKKKEVGKGDVESPVRGVEKGRSDFWQFSETSAKWKSAIEDTTTSQGKGKTRKHDSHLEKHVQEEETGPLRDTSYESTIMLTKREEGDRSFDIE